MKKTVCMVVCLAMMFCCGGCLGEDIIVNQGFSNFSVNDSMFGVCGGTLRLGKIIEETYEYIEGDYYWYFNGYFAPVMIDSAFMYFVFDDGVYEEAKQFVLEHSELSDRNQFTYNGYCFYEETVDNEYWEFPYSFFMVAFHEEKKIITFMGVYTFDGEANSRKDVIQSLTNGDIKPFLKECFSCYDFSK